MNMIEESKPVVQTYNLYDAQADKFVEEMSLNAMREWLADLWDNNPDDEMSDEEHEEMTDEIRSADPQELNERLSGVGYYMRPAVHRVIKVKRFRIKKGQ